MPAFVWLSSSLLSHRSRERGSTARGAKTQRAFGSTVSGARKMQLAVAQ